jgi:hypothetical protein
LFVCDCIANELANTLIKSLLFWTCISAFFVVSAVIDQPKVLAQLSTPDHVSGDGFWPTQTKYDSREYVGSPACAGCHRTVFDSQQQTSMAHAAVRAGASSILRSNPDLTFAPGFARYGIHTEGGKSVYSASNGRGEKSAELVWAFGTNRVAQSYLFKRKDGEFLEARVTYFLSLSALDFTPGRAVSSENNLDETTDREVGRAEVYRCFACHTTMSGLNRSFDEDKLVPGIQCEGCHGPGAEHVAEMKGRPTRTGAAVPAMQETEKTPYRILNPKKLTPEENLEFCGSCHGSYWDVSLSGSTGVGNARFEPYRLEQSKCWNKNDARLTCTACHDPHKELAKDATDYDHVCLSCHVTKNAVAQPKAVKFQQDHLGAACPRAVKECTACHMPQVYVPAMHGSFPDHRIRIVREGEAFPD